MHVCGAWLLSHVIHAFQGVLFVLALVMLFVTASDRLMWLMACFLLGFIYCQSEGICRLFVGGCYYHCVARHLGSLAYRHLGQMSLKMITELSRIYHLVNSTSELEPSA